MKKHQTTKHRKQQKKEKANRKVKHEHEHKLEEHMSPKQEDKQPQVGSADIPKPEDKPVSELLMKCAWCGKDMDSKDGQGVSGTSHDICPICPECYAKETAKVDAPVSAARKAFERL